MFETTFIREDLVLIVHRKGEKAIKNLLDDPNAIFVWGELMDPHFIKGLLGRYVAFAPAKLARYERIRTKDFFDAVRKSGGTIQGVVLLGLTKKDVAKLDRFEKVGEVMRRATGRVEIGHFARRIALYLKK